MSELRVQQPDWNLKDLLPGGETGSTHGGFTSPDAHKVLG